MADWENMKDRKSKNKKRKHTASISEPVDLKAGEYIDQSAVLGAVKLSIDPAGTPVAPHAVGVLESSEGDSLTEDSTLAASKVFMKHQQ
ncbi:uncharacterized protein EKO05_0009679 [Ascochyta rabiei]|uniref:Uncharacterized protein n=1 Tax=Didymella rabiei TaxID=5454 RepID=A0A163CLZ7_DIDRA|nr:uncharacterized protein EKO05_0009679 [Ascochyta rabiei]KZM22556.1 hypothetical protein ST47_g6206 [Ascochyta rabiei]UPX19416.1 hypothetical protein EKO05_0009679 [Ascochyta rabiei]